jgi:hypothetical protein
MKEHLGTRTVALVPILLLLSFGVLFSQESTKCLALLTDLRGEVFVKGARGTEFRKAPWGTQLYAGDIVRTSTTGSASLLLANNELIALGPGSSMTVSEGLTSSQNKPKTISGIGSGNLVDLSGLTMRSTGEGEFVALAGLRGVSPDFPIEQLSPRNTALRSLTPAFSWRSSVQVQTFKIRLYNSEGPLWTKETNQTTIEYPKDEKPLNYGEKYFWKVEGLGLVDSYRSATIGFTLLSKENVARIKNEERSLKSSFSDDSTATSYHFLAGTLYHRRGLLEESISEFETVAQRYPDAPAAHEVLGRLYNDVGLKDKAIAALQKALKLSQGK